MMAARLRLSPSSHKICNKTITNTRKRATRLWVAGWVRLVGNFVWILTQVWRSLWSRRKRSSRLFQGSQNSNRMSSVYSKIRMLVIIVIISNRMSCLLLKIVCAINRWYMLKQGIKENNSFCIKLKYRNLHSVQSRQKT